VKTLEGVVKLDYFSLSLGCNMFSDVI